MFKLEGKNILIGAVTLIIAVSLIIVLIVGVEDTKYVNRNSIYLEENHSVSAGIPFGLFNPNLLTIEAVWNSSDSASNSWTTDNYTIMFNSNSTINTTFTSGNLSFNYTARTRNDTGLSSASTILISLIILIFVAGIVMWFWKIKMGK